MRIKKYIIAIILGFIIIPQVTFAAWWNPLSWNIFSSLLGDGSQQTSASTTTASFSDTSTTEVKTEATVTPVLPAKTIPIKKQLRKWRPYLFKQTQINRQVLFATVHIGTPVRRDKTLYVHRLVRRIARYQKLPSRYVKAHMALIVQILARKIATADLFADVRMGMNGTLDRHHVWLKLLKQVIKFAEIHMGMPHGMEHHILLAGAPIAHVMLDMS